MIYRRYEKVNEKKNYTKIVEIFSTVERPYYYYKDNKELNDFLGRNAFKRDMNCSKNESDENLTDENLQTTTRKEEQTTTTTKPITTSTQTSTTTTRFTIPTTAYRRALKERSTSPRTPNLDQLFTIRSTRPTIRSNPKQNENPDYTELYSWPTPSVQVTKYPPSSTTRPLLVIKETDDHPNQNRTTLEKIDEEYKNEKTTEKLAPSSTIKNEIVNESGTDSDEEFDENETDYEPVSDEDDEERK
jgi:hypothetical protein